VHEINSQFPDKCDIKSVEHTTVLTSALHNVYHSKQNHVFIYLWNCAYLCLYLAEWLLLFGTALLAWVLWFLPILTCSLTLHPHADHIPWHWLGDRKGTRPVRSCFSSCQTFLFEGLWRSRLKLE